MLICGTTQVVGKSLQEKDFYDLPSKDTMASADNQRYLAEAPGLFELFLEDDNS